MMKTPDGILLNLQPFPPRGEIMRDLLLVLKERDIHTFYIDPDRQFCWSFDPALKDSAAYPEEFFRGLLATAESLGLTLIPVLSTRRIFEFIHAHPGTKSSVLPEKGAPQISIIQHLVEDMVEDLLSVFAMSPCIAVTDCGLEDAEGSETMIPGISEILEGVAEAFEENLISIEPGECSYVEAEEIRAGFSGIVRVRSRRFSGFSLPSPPAWLELLPEPLVSRVAEFTDSYARTDTLFNEAWHLLRLRWERRTGSAAPFMARLREIRKFASPLREQGKRLFHSEWFENEQRRWHYSLYEAALHQFAVRPGSQEELSSVRALLDPVSGVKR
ncbi:hypothetical protein [Marispirochaeta aestuarii]|uniref:hypothetical protein n=1 Tax=Marispirochaeta aestuarii TaxID=1963862 RepID=UPI001177B1D4|nr:hypothetical protein [Marispirochaeta aestuarii]